MTKKDEQQTIDTLLSGLPEARRRKLNKENYIGVTVANYQGSWTRVGPSWKVDGELCCVGFGTRTWGTSRGLAQLATGLDAKPTWHACAFSAAQVNLAFSVTQEVLNAPHMAEVKAITEEAIDWMERQQ